MAGWYSSKVNAQVVAAPAPVAPLGIGQVVSALGRTAGAIADQNNQTDRDVSDDLLQSQRLKNLGSHCI